MFGQQQFLFSKKKKNFAKSLQQHHYGNSGESSDSDLSAQSHE